LKCRENNKSKTEKDVENFHDGGLRC
jgi:hypothetical protein